MIALDPLNKDYARVLTEALVPGRQCSDRGSGTRNLEQSLVPRVWEDTSFNAILIEGDLIQGNNSIKFP